MNNYALSISGLIKSSETEAKRDSLYTGVHYLNELGISEASFTLSNFTTSVVGDGWGHIAVAHYSFKSKKSLDELRERAKQRGLDSKLLCLPPAQGQS